MAYSEELAERVRARMSHLDDLTERSVMSGIGFFLNDRMAIAILDDRLCLRVGEATDGVELGAAEALPLEFAGRVVEGWLCIPEQNLDEASLAGWLARGVAGLGLSM